jgi:predicted O-methyltransferase YrrM
VLTLSEVEAVLREIEERARKEPLPIVGRAKGKILENIVRRLGNVKALEVGTLFGYSAIIIARSIPNGHLTCIEKDPANAREAEKNIKKAGLEERITVLVGDASNVIPRLEDVFDFVFLDAKKSEYLKYLKLIEPKLHRGSIIVADNVGIFKDEMKDYLEYVRNSGKYRSSTHELQTETGLLDALAISYKV